MTNQTELEFETCQERQIVGIARDYSMETRGEIPRLWQTFFQTGYEIPNAVSGATYGVSYMANGKGDFRYAVGLEVNPVPEVLPDGTCTVTLSAGDYAVFRQFGPMSELPANFDRLYSEWIPAAGCVPREGAAFERYPEDPRNSPEVMAYEIWAPVTRGKTPG